MNFKFVTHTTGSCTHVDIGQVKEKDVIHYLSQQTTICFTCPALPPSLASNEFYWFLGETRLAVNQMTSQGTVFPNGTLLILNSSQIFSSDNATKLSCTNSTQTTELQSTTVYLGGRLITL